MYDFFDMESENPDTIKERQKGSPSDARRKT
jgi:hypothetical protein